jgi:capsular polysaccharide biosynthesis protein
MKYRPSGQQRRKTIIILMSLLGAQSGLLVCLLKTPTYQARTSLEIRSRRGRPSMHEILTQVKILESESLSNRARQRLSSDPEMDRVQLQFASRHLTVRPIGSGGAIEVLSIAADPKLAASFTNALVSEFIERDREIRRSMLESTADALHWTEKSLQEAIGSSDIRVVHAAETPLRPLARKVRLGVSLGLVSGLLAAMAYLRIRTKFVVGHTAVAYDLSSGFRTEVQGVIWNGFAHANYPIQLSDLLKSR